VVCFEGSHWSLTYKGLFTAKPSSAMKHLSRALSGILSACIFLAPSQAASTDAATLLERPLGVSNVSSEKAPFGANLFNGGFSNDREDGLNPGYVLQPGDRVSVRIWGATEFNDSLPLDPQGNIFLPGVGPIALAGTVNRDLNDRVRRAVATVFTDNVHVYTSLDGSQPVAVFVTGSVSRPGRFAGIPSNSVLHFVDRAGGIDPERGSYRDIRLLRDGQLLTTLDLYDFLRDGSLEKVQFQDGDTILVGARGDTVEVSGDVANAARFELSNSAFSGEKIVELAQLKAGVTHAGLTGVRHGESWSVYLPLDEFRELSLENGDRVSFRSDQRERVMVVEVEGSYIGPSQCQKCGA